MCFGSCFIGSQFREDPIVPYISQLPQSGPVFGSLNNKRKTSSQGKTCITLLMELKSIIIILSHFSGWLIICIAIKALN